MRTLNNQAAIAAMLNTSEQVIAKLVARKLLYADGNGYIREPAAMAILRSAPILAQLKSIRAEIARENEERELAAQKREDRLERLHSAIEVAEHAGDYPLATRLLEELNKMHGENDG